MAVIFSCIPSAERICSGQSALIRSGITENAVIRPGSPWNADFIQQVRRRDEKEAGQGIAPPLRRLLGHVVHGGKKGAARHGKRRGYQLFQKTVQKQQASGRSQKGNAPQSQIGVSQLVKKGGKRRIEDMVVGKRPVDHGIDHASVDEIFIGIQLIVPGRDPKQPPHIIGHNRTEEEGEQPVVPDPESRRGFPDRAACSAYHRLFLRRIFAALYFFHSGFPFFHNRRSVTPAPAFRYTARNIFPSAPAAARGCPVP